MRVRLPSLLLGLLLALCLLVPVAAQEATEPVIDYEAWASVETPVAPPIWAAYPSPPCTAQ